MFAIETESGGRGEKETKKRDGGERGPTTFAESTMNELLGWYGYDKVELRDSEASEIRNYRERRQHVSVLKENSLPKPKSAESKVGHSVLAMKSGERESSTEDVQNVPIVCVWCQKEGVKRYSLCMGSELKSFCSEKCFAACRRAYFKRNKARDEDANAERSPQNPHVEDSPRLVLKMNSTVRVCDWCKHIRHTKEYLDFGSGDERLQFCSTKCLNQYKMDVFYREARAALTSTPSSGSSPGGTGQEGRADGGAGGGPSCSRPSRGAVAVAVATVAWETSAAGTARPKAPHQSTGRRRPAQPLPPRRCRRPPPPPSSPSRG
ncbi:hypothetical protein NHX12_026260 [Muraenolepis orangiensis]|uniref:Sine oculis-binding protein-like protein n=1 Tax=Muraenolepis orangiensis TaxID=630683 RepID=A0A9Q0EH64_9TELE|nr:hypothetical protein NHX12_026260 [Muraenolepis orangiensis]